MDLGTCWQSGVWADGSWVDGSWCPNEPCIPYSPGICWQEVWCNNSWVSGSWCISTPPVPVVTVDNTIHWAGPPIVIYREKEIDEIPFWKRKREDEEIILL